MSKPTFKEQLKSEKERIGLTQQELAKATGISKRTVAAWLGGESEPPEVYQEGLFPRLKRLKPTRK